MSSLDATSTDVLRLPPEENEPVTADQNDVRQPDHEYMVPEADLSEECQPGKVDVHHSEPPTKSPHPSPLPPGEGEFANEPPLRVMALHALLYCERLFYLEEVEEIRVADAAVYAGRRLHVEVADPDDETPEKRSLDVSSERWGLLGKVDAVRRRDGAWVAIEHKRGRCRRDDNGKPDAWPSDRIQAVAYAVLVEEGLGEPVPQARIRYHADGVTAFVEIDDAARRDLEAAIRRGRELRHSLLRPPVTENENLCPRCSLAPVCLPEEERLAREEQGAGSAEQEADGDGEARADQDLTQTEESGDKSPHSKVSTLFPSRREQQTLHIVSPRATWAAAARPCC